MIEFDDVGICVIGLAHYMLLKMKKKMHGVS